MKGGVLLLRAFRSNVSSPLSVLRLCLPSALIAPAVLTAYPTAVLAQPADVVREIVVEGIQRIEPETVRSYLTIQPGDRFDDERIDQSLKSLFATGLFADVSIRRQGDALVVRVVENPVINRIAFEGNRRLSTEALQAETQLKPRSVYTRTKVQNDVARLLEVYRRSGRFGATIEPKIITLPQNRIDLVFEIDEGPRTEIETIRFIGNKRFSDRRLRDEIRTKEARWYRFFTADDTYDPDRLTFDRELLRRFYLSEGYADFRVASAVAELSPERDAFFVTFTIEEGERYRFGNIGVRSKLPQVDEAILREQLTVMSGEWYDAGEVDQSIERLTDLLGSLGYAFVEVRPEVERNRENRTVDLVFNIEEGPRVFVERIDIVGNVRTLDEVVRREFRLVEGDAFNTAKLRRSRQRINNLDFFEKVEITNQPGSAPDRTVIRADVQEKSTGELSIGLGYSTSDGVLGEVGLRERNLLGRGQDLRFSVRAAQRGTEVDLSFTEPYFLDRELSAGIDVFRITRDRQEVSSYDERTEGFALRSGFRYTEQLRQDLRYSLRQTTIDDVEPTASRFIREQEGTRVTSLIGQTLLYDRRDSRIDPTEGYFVRFSNDLAGLGGDARYLRNRFDTGFYYPLAEQWVFGFSYSAGYLLELGQDASIADRFFLGGDDLRGFATGGVGPRDTTTGDALGGKVFYTASAALTFPLGFPPELGVSGAAFTDVGTLTDSGESGPGIRNDASLRASVGAGVLWRSPLGPIRLDFAVPVLKEDYDETENLRISFGTRF